jgi:hypothetical protein
MLGRRAVLLACLVAASLAGTVAPTLAADEFPPGYEPYHTHDELTAELQAIAAAHPDITALSTAGTSHKGRPIWLLKISDNVAVDETEPEVFLNGLTHAREHLTVEQSVAAVHWLVDGYGVNARTTALVDGLEVWVMPEINPDGGQFDISNGRFHSWRKNRQPNGPGEPIGTDINRNYAYRWGCCGGSSSSPGSIMYRGSEPFSTPEAQVVRDFVISRRIDGVQQLRIAVSFHSFGEFILFPYGYTTEDVPPDMVRRDRRVLVRMAREMGARNGYTPIQTSSWYIVSGNFGDWAYGDQAILPFTFELAPRRSADGGHYLPADRIGEETRRNRRAILWLLEQAPDPAGVLGPDALPGAAERSTRDPGAVKRAPGWAVAV